MTTKLSPELEATGKAITRLVDYNESEPFIVTDTAWMRYTRSIFDGGIPQNLYIDSESTQSTRRFTAVETDIIELFVLIEDGDKGDIKRLESYDDEGAIKVPEWVMISFLTTKLYYEDYPEKIKRDFCDSNGGLIIDDQLVWSVSKDESGIGW